MWMSILASVLSIGASWGLVYFCYSKIHHSDLIFTNRKSFLDFIKDSFAALVQYEPPPMFVNRPTFTAGLDQEFLPYFWPWC